MLRPEPQIDRQSTPPYPEWLVRAVQVGYEAHQNPLAAWEPPPPQPQADYQMNEVDLQTGLVGKSRMDSRPSVSIKKPTAISPRNSGEWQSYRPPSSADEVMRREQQIREAVAPATSTGVAPITSGALGASYTTPITSQRITPPTAGGWQGQPALDKALDSGERNRQQAQPPKPPEAPKIVQGAALTSEFDYSRGNKPAATPPADAPAPAPPASAPAPKPQPQVTPGFPAIKGAQPTASPAAAPAARGTAPSLGADAGRLGAGALAMPKTDPLPAASSGSGPATVSGGALTQPGNDDRYSRRWEEDRRDDGPPPEAVRARRMLGGVALVMAIMAVALPQSQISVLGEEFMHSQIGLAGLLALGSVLLLIGRGWSAGIAWAFTLPVAALLIGAGSMAHLRSGEPLYFNGFMIPGSGTPWAILAGAGLLGAGILLAGRPPVWRLAVGLAVGVAGIAGMFQTSLDRKPAGFIPSNGQFYDSSTNLSFLKPAGFRYYRWDKIRDADLLTQDLTTPVNFVFLNEAKTVAVYLFTSSSPIPTSKPASLAGRFEDLEGVLADFSGGNPEHSRNRLVGSKGQQIEERVYIGPPAPGKPPLCVVVNGYPIGSRWMYVISQSRVDAFASEAEAKKAAETALNSFFAVM